MRETTLEKHQTCWKGSFSAMASPCDVLMEVDDRKKAETIVNAVANEAWRIEDKFSRYKTDNIIYKVNNAKSTTVTIDEETSRLLDFADTLYDLSEGLFDITSGVLRQVWQFDGSDNVPDENAIKNVLKNIGWDKVVRQQHEITVPAGMEIDLGGIGKEYAVDRCVQLVRGITENSVLINFGGDLAVTVARKDNACWSVGRLVTGSDETKGIFQLYRGAIATSGDAHRYLLKDGIRYSHILNPKTGTSVIDAPHTISVAAPTCIEAGMMSTLAMLQGSQAEDFLKLQNINYWLN